MPVLKNFEPNPDVPFYISCMIPLLYEKIRYNGSRCALSLLTNLEFSGLPTYSVSHDLKTAWMDSSPAPRLLGYPSSFSYYFGLKNKIFEYRTPEEGLAAISRQISKGQIMILSGTTYFLPYTKDYQKPAYLENYPHPIFGVADHWLAVTGITDQQVFVFDPIPNKYFGPISHGDFAGFWRGNRGIPELQTVPGINNLKSYLAIQGSVRKKVNSHNAKKLHLQTMKTILVEYLRGTIQKDNERTYFMGKSAAIQLKADLLRALKQGSTEGVPPMFTQCFMDLRFSRYFFRDLLCDLTNLYGLAKDYSESYLHLVERWEALGVYFSKIVESRQMNAEKINKTLTLMDEAIQNEQAFHENLLKLLGESGPIKLLPCKIKK